MVKLIFKEYKKTDKIYYIFIYKNVNRILSNKQRQTLKKPDKSTKVFLKKQMTKRANIILSNIEIFLKKEKKISVNMVVN